MPSFSAVCQRILSYPETQGRMLVGGLLAMVPLVNLVSMGYLVQYARNVRSGRLELPPWAGTSLQSLLRDGVLFFFVALIWTGLPALLGSAVTVVLLRVVDFLFSWFPLVHSLASTVSWMPFILSLAAGVPLTVCAVLRSVDSDRFDAALEFGEILHAVNSRAGMLAVPTLAAYGIIAIGWPLYGFAFFIPVLLLLAYYGLALDS